jgi:hypothetical protein
LGYIASDIVARFKRVKGFNVLHPMGFDAFGLPAEQYALEHGIHPAVSTADNINNFKRQLGNIGFSTTGVARYKPAIQNIIVGRSGSSYRFSIAGLIVKKKKPNVFRN